MANKAKISIKMNDNGKAAFSFFGVHSDIRVMIVHAMDENEELRQLFRHSVHCYNMYEKTKEFTK